jgi:hypothetical protein
MITCAAYMTPPKSAQPSGGPVLPKSLLECWHLLREAVLLVGSSPISLSNVYKADLDREALINGAHSRQVVLIGVEVPEMTG